MKSRKFLTTDTYSLKQWCIWFATCLGVLIFKRKTFGLIIVIIIVFRWKVLTDNYDCSLT